MKMRLLLLATALIVACEEGTAPRGPIDRITLSGVTQPMPGGATAALSVTAVDAEGRAIQGRTFVWTSSDEKVATVSGSGVVTAKAPGAATITAASEGKAGALDLIVVLGPAASITITPGESIMYPRTNRLLTATLHDPAGNLIPSTAFSWATPDLTKANVSPSGTVFARDGENTVEISASASGVTGFAKVHVKPIKMISLGRFHGCSLTRDGIALCWGRNINGELGTGSARNDTSLFPQRVSGNLRFTSITAGGGHTCGLTSDGRAYCWGSNSDGQIGEGTNVNRNSPIPAAPQLAFAEVTSGETHTCGLTTAGEIHCWGNGSVSPVKVISPVSLTKLTAGNRFTCGLDSTGAAYCWGTNEWGELGTGNTTATATPVAVTGGLRFRSIDTGGSAACGIATDDMTYCWGNLRWDIPSGRRTPTRVPGDNRFATLSVSDSHLCAITPEPVTWCIGFPGDGEMGNGIKYGLEVDGIFTLTSFVRVERWTNLVSIAVGWGSSCAVNEPGTPICWGYWARIGMGNDTMRWIPAEQAQPQ